MITSMLACFYTGIDLLHEPYTMQEPVVVVKLTTHTHYIILVMHLSMASPTPGPTPWVGWGNSGDLTEYHVKNPSPGALPDVNTPIYCQELIGD